MVKFTFGSTFLTLASVFTLASAIPSGSYKISSVQTGEFIFSDGSEKDGDQVTTVSQANSGNSVGDPSTKLILETS